MTKDKSEDNPPHSRVFVLHSKDSSKERLEELFKKYGNVEDVYMVKDRNTGGSKGVTYVKYSKMSEAARAMEELNGTLIDGQNRPLKVIIANSRNQGSKRDDNEAERFLRIFIVVPKDNTVTEDGIKSYFSQFGEIDYVFVLRDRDTDQSKGFAYVKYFKVSDTAKALEECDVKYKAVLARPKEKRGEANYNKTIKEYQFNVPPARRPDTGPGPSRSGGAFHNNITPRDYIEYNEMFNGRGFTTMSALVSAELSEDQACALFDLVPGMTSAYLTPDTISYRTQRFVLEYASPQCAEYAYEKLNGFEYPIGEPIMLKPEGMGRGGPPQITPSALKRKYPGTYDGKTIDDVANIVDAEMSNQLVELTDALAEATSIIKAAGLTIGSPQDHCSAKLPPIQPIVKNAEGLFRLFIVCQPEAPPLSSLKDVFCRFGNLTDIYLLPHRNCGYACFSSHQSALDAMHVMHEQELFGNRLKVIEADPPRASNKKTRYE